MTETAFRPGAALSNRARNLRGGEESPFLRMMRLASRYDGLINLGRGDPDLPTPRHIVEAAKAALDRGETKYTPPAGLPALRAAIAEDLRRRHDLNYDPAGEILVTDGTQEAIYLAVQCLVNPGDEVIIPDPCYANYEMSVAMAGGKLVRVPTRLEDEFELTAEAIEAAITPKTRVLALISPSNPTGAAILPATLEKIARLAAAHDLVVISDELYEHVVYDGLKLVSFPTLPGMRERTVLVNGVSKSHCMTGLRIGYVAAPAEIAAGMLEPRHTISICAGTISQHAALAALTGPQDCLAKNLATYEKRRALITHGLRAGGVRFGAPRGAFFVFADIRPTGLSSMRYCEEILERERVLIFPGHLYGPAGEGFVRISYLAPEDQIEEAAARIARFSRTVAR
jgi:aspartate/methionine/tyrosine aminotransferase